MALRIPIGADQTLQVEFHEIERRLRRLERATGASSSSNIVQFVGGGGVTQKVDLKPITDRLDALDDIVAGLSDPAGIIGDFGAVGATSKHGLVPEPGVSIPPTGVAQHLVTESGTWGFPLRGLAGVVTPGDETVGSDTINLLGNVIATGKLLGSALETGGEIRANGIVYGELEQANLRGLMQVLTDLGQNTYPTDILNLLGSLAVTGCLSAETITCNDIHINGTLDGGTP